MKIAFCVIAEGDKNLSGLKKLFESIEGVFDSHHITCNGTDYDEVQKWCEENNYDFSYLKWNDNFAEQRNFNFARAPKDVDYVVWADSDDVIMGAEKLRDICSIAKAREFDVVFFEYWYGAKFDGEPSLENFVEQEITQRRERIINPRNTVWKKRIHETPVPIDDTNFKYSRIDYKKFHTAWLHLGAAHDISDVDMNAKLMRNKRLLEKELMDERKDNGEADPRTILYLMKIYAESDDKGTLEACIELGREYIKKSGWDQERAVCYQLMSKCIGKLGYHAEARDFLMDAIKEYPYIPSLYLYLARAYFNLEDYRAMHYWMKIGLNQELDDTNTSMDNILELKLLSTELLTEYYLHGERDIRKAFDAAKKMYKLNRTERNKKIVEELGKQDHLDRASENVDKLTKYLVEIDEESKIPDLIRSMPKQMRDLPFAWKHINRYSPPRTWKDNEICYFANFHNFAFEKWSGKSLERGLGGSERAVVKISEYLTSKGFKVTVYGDPGKEEGIHNGVIYLPHYKFNPRDKFNIFIQWRNNTLAGKVHCKKFLVDLHDVWFPESYRTKLPAIDKIMVKSNFHREYGKGIPDDKFNIISNGI